MNVEIRNRPDYASLHIFLNDGESVVTESGAMMGMHPDLKMETNMKGGLLGAAKRALGGESVFLNTYTATGEDQRLDLAPQAPGDIVEVDIGGPTGGPPVMVQRGGYLAMTPEVVLDSKWAGAKSFFAGEALIMLRGHGEGKLWICSYGAIEAIDVDGSYIVDTSHIVAFQETLTYSLRKVGGLKSLFLSQEGIVCEFKGTGRLWVQTRNAPNLASFLHPFRRVKSND